MNVNSESKRFTETVAWDSLTDAEKASGDWIELPTLDNEPRRARKLNTLEKAFGVRRDGESAKDFHARRLEETKAALVRPR